MHQLKNVYALQDPTCPVRGLYFRLDGELPRLKPAPQACLAPATPEGLAWIAKRAAQRLVGIPHEIVRVVS